MRSKPLCTIRNVQRPLMRIFTDIGVPEPAKPVSVKKITEDETELLREGRRCLELFGQTASYRWFSGDILANPDGDNQCCDPVAKDVVNEVTNKVGFALQTL